MNLNRSILGLSFVVFKTQSFKFIVCEVLLYNSIHSSKGEAFVPAQATSFITTGIVEISTTVVELLDQLPVVSFAFTEKEYEELSLRIKIVEVAVVVETTPLFENS